MIHIDVATVADTDAFLASAVAGHLVGRLYGPGSVHPVRGADLESIHVYPAHRSAGIGSLLIEAFPAWASERGAFRASVTAYAENEAALRFYRRHGFTVRSVTADRPIAASRSESNTPNAG